MLTKNNKNVIIENVDSDKQNLRKSKFAEKIKQKNILKSCWQSIIENAIIQKLSPRQKSTLKSKQWE